jgi:hypothetical protein
MTSLLSDCLLTKNYICFDITNQYSYNDAQFGILNFEAVEYDVNTHLNFRLNESSSEFEFIFMIDCSGSMSDMCLDHRSKMQHIIHTLKNIIIFFHENPTINVNITIYAFDTNIYPVVSRTKITDDNLNNIMHKISQIVPRGSTNIEIALRKISEEVTLLSRKFPNNDINHIFMTDGECTDGSSDITVLQNLINSNITNAFIGFGIEHDDILLNGISNQTNSSYYFIDKLERAGLVYGEILHGIIYKLMTNVEIVIENGVIYNYKSNTWDNSLQIGSIASQSNKIFNIASNCPENCKVNIKGTVDGVNIMFPSNLTESTDLTIHIYRQRTLELLYDVNIYIKQNKNRNYNRITETDNLFMEQHGNLKVRMISLMEEMKKYMSDNHLDNNKILKNLCDDIYICYQTIDTRYGSMFCTARQTSQGTQRLYTVSEITDNLYYIPILQRQTNSLNLNHTMSDFEDTPYLTPQATQIMREISRPHTNSNENHELSNLTQRIH